MKRMMACFGAMAFILAVAPGWAADQMELKVVLHPDWGPTGNNLAWTGKPSALYRLAFAKFNEKYPNIKIVGEEILGDTEGRDKYLLAARQGNPPDVMGIDGFWAAAFASIGALVPLDNLLPKELLSDYYDAFKLKYGGKIICLVPGTDFNSMLWYRKDLFKEVGLTKPPENWNELREYARKLTRNGRYGLALSGQKSELTTVTVLGFYWQGSDKFMNDDGTPAYNNQASLDAFKFFADLYKNKWLPPETINDGYAETQQLFFTDKVAMMLHGSWLKSRMDELAPNLKGKIGLAPNPRDPRTGNWGQNSGGWGIAVTTKDPAKQEAAAYLVSLIAGLDKNIYREWLHEVGNIPTTKSAAADPSFRATEWDRTVMDNLKYSHTRPVNALYPDASLEWAQAFQETLLGADPQKALAGAVQRAVQIGKDKGLLQ